MTRVDPDRLRAFAAAVYERCGVPMDDARLVADTLVQAELWGHASHGPGEIEARHEARNRMEGIALPEATLAVLADVSGESGVAWEP